MTLSEVVAHHARSRPDAPAFLGGDPLTWGEYDARACELATQLAQTYPERGTRIAVQMPDGPDVHVMYLAAERAGLVVVGVGPRAGTREVDHLLAATGAAELITTLPLATPGSGGGELDASRAFPADELWFLNSTSGTTGLPKIVMHHQARWFAFHELAVQTGALTEDDVFMSVLPAPFGFGLWTAHFTPAILGSPCVLLDRFSAEATLGAIETHRVTVLAAVSTQFVMLLNSPAAEENDLSSLRVLYTGGEMVPYARAAEFEDRTGARVLQFYGSNETGALSATRLGDTRDTRLRTAGHVLPGMSVRLVDPDTGADVTRSGGPGVAACRGPVTSHGYYEDDAANRELFTTDGWMRTGDLCTIDADGVLTVVGRTSDFIIRGGKNISAAQVEDEVSQHPAVALCAAVAMADPVFGERVCVYVVIRPDISAPNLDDVRAHLESRGVGKELWPEHLVVLDDDLPRASGGKVAKAALRADAATQITGP
ncbi:MAG: class I adenylate-forming enzyme family protein [Acidimicrobiia bacterium]